MKTQNPGFRGAGNKSTSVFAKSIYNHHRNNYGRPLEPILQKGRNNCQSLPQEAGENCLQYRHYEKAEETCLRTRRFLSAMSCKKCTPYIGWKFT
ncbi:Uncharacterized protein HZ326_18691 [Fusarium oxysporum f. sp. albedinis]|nr:Uncharacterized protein HZ326_18691 [Fusarium oxysporum f. sp. albedinis]